MARRSLFCCALLPPESIAGGVETDYLPIRICVGHIGAWLVANQTRAPPYFSDDGPREAGDVGWTDLACDRRARWELARGHEKADPDAQLDLVHVH